MAAELENQIFEPIIMSSRNIMNGVEEETIIDLTDDTTNESTRAVQDIEFVGEAVTLSCIPRRRESTDSDIVILEDEVATVEDVLPVPEVACHFFYPEEDGGGGSGPDPLAPVPEWVDCSTVHSEQVTVDNELLISEASPEQSIDSSAFVDPLSMTTAIKTEPGTEIDVKPSLAQLSQMASAVNRDSGKLNSAQKINSVTKQESLNCNNVFKGNGVSKRRSPHDIDLNGTSTPKKRKTEGPKCAQFKENDMKISSTNTSIKDHSAQNNYGNTSTSLSTTSIKRVGPKCAKFRLTEQNTTVEPHSKVLPSKRIGPKCAKFRLEEQNTTVEPDSEALPKKIRPKCAEFRLEEPNAAVEPISKELSTKKIGPKCAKFRQKERNKTVEQLSEAFRTKRIGPKCAKFRQKEQNTVIESHSVALPTQRIGPKCAKFKIKEQNTAVEPHSKALPIKRIGPKCAKFRLKEQNTTKESYYEDLLTKRIGPKCAKLRLKEANTSVEPHSKALPIKRIGPKCAKFRLKEHKKSEEPNSKELGKKAQDWRKNLNVVIKPAVVAIGPKLPLPQCFQQKKSLSLDSGENMNELTDKISCNPENHFDQDHIVLKIYTCFNCNHKCTDPLFHEEHVNLCISKRRSTKTLNLPLQDFIKQDGFYKCEICTFKFKAQENLINHLKQHGMKGFVCHICQLTFLTLRQLHEHSMSDHKNLVKVFSCNSCEYSTQKMLHLRYHMVKHNTDRHLFCFHHKQNYEDVKEMEQHREECHGCSRKTRGETSVNGWIENSRKESILRDQKTTKISENKDQSVANKDECPLFDNRTPFLATLKGHFTRHTNHEKQLETESHQNSTEGEPNQTKVTKTKKFEERPIDSSSTSKCLSCKVCNFKCNNAVALQEHKFKHERTQGQLGMASGSDSVLEEEFRCNRCTFKSSQPSVYIEHIKRNHKRKLICNVCRSEFNLLKYYKEHMMNHAACAVVYSCNECRFTSRKKQIYEKHMRLHTLKRCPLCNYKAERYARLQSHLETLHTVEKEYPLPWSPNTHDVSAVEPKEEFSETSDSKLENGTLKSQDCCFCSYKTTDVHKLRNHMAIHFKNADTKIEKQSNKISKQSLTMERWRNKTLHTKTIGRGITKVSQRHSNVSNGSIPIYCCTKCEYKKKCRRTVSQHLLKKHNIRGSVRNRTINKIFVKSPPTENTETNSGLKDYTQKRNTTNLENNHDYEPSCGSDQDECTGDGNSTITEADGKGIRDISKIMKQSKFPSLPWKCSSCDLQKLPLLAQLQHNKLGHTAFWQRRVSCKFCGVRLTHNNNMPRHIKMKHNGILIRGGNGKCPDCNIESLPEPAQHQHSELGHEEFSKRPFSCDICKKRFLKKDNYNKHQKCHKSKFSQNKGNRSTSVESEDIKKQPSCSLGEIDVKREVTSNFACSNESGTRGCDSDEEENYVCGECDFVTTNVIKFSTHMFIHSGIPDD